MAVETWSSETTRDRTAHLRKQFVLVLASITLSAAVVGIVAQIIAQASRGAFNSRGLATVIFVSLINGFIIWLVRRNRTELASNLLVVLFLISYLAIPAPILIILLGTLTVISAAILSNTVLFITTNVLVLAKVVFLIVQTLQGDAATTIEEAGVLAIQGGALLIVSVVTRYFTRTAQSTADQAQRNADLLRATADVSQILSKLLELDELFARSVELIRDRFAYYHVQIFVVDQERRFAVLRASTGEVGQQLIEQGYKVPVGSMSVIGRVTQLGEPIIAHNTDTSHIHSQNELLPNTRAELAVPILETGRIIGALDVQSTRSDAFDPLDVQALQIMADNLGTSIRNARLFEAQEVSVQENKRLFFESEANLREIQRLNRQLTKQAWDDYLSTHHDFSGITIDAMSVTNAADWTSPMIEASQQQRPIHGDGEDRTVAVPIILRGEVIGAIEVESGSEEGLDDPVEMIQTVAQRLAISLDNARLFEEAQESTMQEQRINEIVSQYQTAATVDDLLQITLTELSETLGAQGGAIRLAPQRRSTSSSGHEQEAGQNGGTSS